METGVHKWEVVIDNSKSSNIMIGVCEKKQSLLQFVGGDAQGKKISHPG
jgi:GTP cyclohydrolase III